MPKRAPRAMVEWVGGTTSLPTFVAAGDGADGEQPWRPEVLLWLSADGAILGSLVANPSELLGLACDNLRETIARPAWGEPHAPTRVRVAVPELAAVLAKGCPGIEVVCAPTPELDVVVEGMQSHVLATDDEASWFSPHVDAAALASFFRAAAALYRRRPWDVVPGDEGALFVTIQSLEVFDSPLMVIGQLGESFGLLLFEGVDELEQFGSAMEEMEAGGQPEVPPYLVLNFERGAELPPSLRREIAVNHWEVASVDAYPMLLSMQPGMLSRPATARELAVMEVVALALPRVLDDAAAMRRAWDGGEDCIYTLSVAAHGGDVDVLIGTCPTDEATIGEEELSNTDLLDLLDELGVDGAEVREERRHYEALLLAPFYDSPVGEPFAAERWSSVLFDIVAQHTRLPLTMLRPPALEEALFVELPRRVAITPAQVPGIIEELRGVFLYLACESDLEAAGACADVLRHVLAEHRLRDAIAQRPRARAPRAGPGPGPAPGKGKGNGKTKR